YLEGVLKDRFSAMEKVDAAEQSELAALRMRQLEASGYYKQLFGDITRYSYKTLKAIADQTEKVLSSAKSEKGKDGQDYVWLDIPKIDDEGNEFVEKTKFTIEAFQKFQEQYNLITARVQQKNPFEKIA